MPLKRGYPAAVQPTPYEREPGYALRYRDHRFASGHGPRTDRRERATIRRLLATTAPSSGPWLDVPSGTGRMTAELPGPTVQVDRNVAMLLAVGAPPVDAPRPPRWAASCACASALPFADASFAGVLCCRLLQHLPQPEERIAVLAELRRVSRGPVIISFFDAHSLLHLRRVLRRAIGKPRSGRSAIARRRFAAEAAAAGLRPVRLLSLGRFVAEQTFALCLPIR